MKAENSAIVDSLSSRLDTEVNALQIVVIHNELAWQYRQIDLELAYYHAKQAKQVALLIHYDPGLGDAYSRLGTIAKYSGKMDSAMYFHEKSLVIRRRLGDSVLVAKALTSISSLYQSAGKYDLALKNELHSLKLRKRYDKSSLANAYNNLGVIYLNIGSPDSAIHQFKQGLFVAGKNKEIVGQLYTNLAVAWYELDSVGLAIRNLELALNHEKDIGNHIGVYKTVANIASILLDEAKPRAAVLMLLEQKDALQAEGFNQALPLIHYQLGRAYRGTNNYDSALFYFNKSRELQRFSPDPDLKKEVARELMLLYVHFGMTDSALMEAERFEHFAGELFSDEMSQAIAETETKYKTASLRAQAETQKVELLKSKINLWSTGLSLTLLLIFVGGIAYRMRQRSIISQKNEQLKQHQIDELLQKQELASINAMMEGQEQERQRIAQDLHDRIGSQLAAVKLNMEALEDKVDKGHNENKGQFTKTYGMLDNLVDEVRKISHNMVSGVLMKFGLEVALHDLAASISNSGKIRVDVRVHNLHDRIAGKVELAVYRIIQELLANVLKHAQAQHITISLNRQDGNLNVMVEDDGRGFDQGRVKRGMGLQNIQQRAEALNGAVNIDAKAGRGTTVIVDIPLT